MCGIYSVATEDTHKKHSGFRDIVVFGSTCMVHKDAQDKSFGELGK